MQPMYVSQDQYDRLKGELDKLKLQERPKVVAAIAEARAHGDLSENAEYDAAKEKQYYLERKIARLEETLARARVMQDGDHNPGRVRIGCRVKLIDVTTNEETIYELVPTAEFDASHIDSISVDSPVGKALVGKQVDDIVEIQIPRGMVNYRIAEIQ